MTNLQAHREMVESNRKYAWLDEKLTTKWIFKAMDRINHVVSSLPWYAPVMK